MTRADGPIARFDWHTAITAAPDTSAELVAALDSYFAPFAQPAGEVDEYDGKWRVVEGHPCLKCDKPLSGLVSFLLGGGFTWGIAHGEGHCSACHWPARAHHFIKMADGSDAATIRNFVLQYHPDFVTEKKRGVA